MVNRFDNRWGGSELSKVLIFMVLFPAAAFEGMDPQLLLLLASKSFIAART
jgi:hypothetical protein